MCLTSILTAIHNSYYSSCICKYLFCYYVVVWFVEVFIFQKSNVKNDDLPSSVFLWNGFTMCTLNTYLVNFLNSCIKIWSVNFITQVLSWIFHGGKVIPIPTEFPKLVPETCTRMTKNFNFVKQNGVENWRKLNPG